MYEVTGSIPLPKKRVGRKKGTSKYPFAIMGIGDSFFAPNVKLASFRATTYRHAALLGRKYTVRQTLEGNVLGIRVWRVK